MQICWSVEKKDILAKCPLYRKPRKTIATYRYQRSGKPVVWTQEEITKLNQTVKGTKNA